MPRRTVWVNDGTFKARGKPPVTDDSGHLYVHFPELNTASDRAMPPHDNLVRGLKSLHGRASDRDPHGALPDGS